MMASTVSGLPEGIPIMVILLCSFLCPLLQHNLCLCTGGHQSQCLTGFNVAMEIPSMSYVSGKTALYLCNYHSKQSSPTLE